MAERALREQNTPVNPSLILRERRKWKRERESDTDSDAADINDSRVVSKSSGKTRTTSYVNSNYVDGDSDVGYGHTNPRDLVLSDLNRPTKSRSQEDLVSDRKPSSTSGSNNHLPRDRRERAPPPSTRVFDRIPWLDDSDKREPLYRQSRNNNVIEQKKREHRNIGKARQGAANLDTQLEDKLQSAIIIKAMAAAIRNESANLKAAAPLEAIAEVQQRAIHLETLSPDKKDSETIARAEAAVTAVFAVRTVKNLEEKLNSLVGSNLMLNISNSPDYTARNNSARDDDARSETSVRSGTSSIISVTERIFSIATGSSMSSIAGPQSAVERLVSLLLNDSDIKSSCTFFLVNNDDCDFFERNLRRLLKEFAVGLRQEAESAQQRHAAHFVRLCARNSAYMICSTLNKKNRETTEEPDVELDYLSEEIESDSSDDEVDDLQGLEAFFKMSKAFETLRGNLKKFVYHRKEKEGEGKQMSQPETTAHQPVSFGEECNEARSNEVPLEFDGSGSLEPEKLLKNERELMCAQKRLNKYGLSALFVTMSKLGGLLNISPSAVPT